MPDPLPSTKAQRVAWVALAIGAAIMAGKFAVFAATNSAAVLSDALESIVNLAAAAMAAICTWYAARPADREHPYGHGKIEFVAAGFEGAMIIFAGASIVIESVRRLLHGAEVAHLDAGIISLLALNLAMGGLAAYVFFAGRRMHSPTLLADGKHLWADVATTFGVILGLGLVKFTGKPWLDPALAILVAVAILVMGWKLVRDSLGGLLDRIDEADDQAIRAILDEEVAAGRILSYHKVRFRHTGAFHWVDLHLQVNAEMTVARAHDIASRIENRIEKHLGQADATAHIEPPERE